MSLYQKLLERAEAGRPVTLGIVGAGQMGTGLVSQMAPLPWFEVVGIADIDLERAKAAYRSAGMADPDVVVVDDLPAAERARAAGWPVARAAGQGTWAAPLAPWRALWESWQALAAERQAGLAER
ncbi:MAG: hypothetical protein ABR564_03745, partial [Candidatus Dormibacteria bacterium]